MNAQTKTVKRTIPPNEQIDVHGGKCTYGQMCDLGRVLDAAIAEQEKDTYDEIETYRRLISVLHPNVRPCLSLSNVRYAIDIARGVRHWREQENRMLKYEPSDEEKQAGYDKLSASSGPTGVAITIAEKFGVAGKPGERVGPDVVFEWPYATVFQVLRIDLDRYKFQKRLSDIRENKRKRKEKSTRWGRKR